MENVKKDFEIMSASCLNLRTGRFKEDRKMDEPICFNCDVCGNKRCVGGDSSVLVKVNYILKSEQKKVQMCEKCLDVFCDIGRFGPKVLGQAPSWERKSRTVRLARMSEETQCSNCQKSLSTHIFLKYDNLNSKGKKSDYFNKKLCARCSISFIEMLVNKDLTSCEFPFVGMKEEEGVIV